MGVSAAGYASTAVLASPSHPYSWVSTRELVDRHVWTDAVRVKGPLSALVLRGFGANYAFLAEQLRLMRDAHGVQEIEFHIREERFAQPKEGNGRRFVDTNELLEAASGLLWTDFRLETKKTALPPRKCRVNSRQTVISCLDGKMVDAYTRFLTQGKLRVSDHFAWAGALSSDLLQQYLPVFVGQLETSPLETEVLFHEGCLKHAPIGGWSEGDVGTQLQYYRDLIDPQGSVVSCLSRALSERTFNFRFVPLVGKPIELGRLIARPN